MADHKVPLSVSSGKCYTQHTLVTDAVSDEKQLVHLHEKIFYAFANIFIQSDTHEGKQKA